MAPGEHDPQFTREFPGLAVALAGQFRVDRELGRGGMGVVYLARDVRLDRPVALKVLPPTLANEPSTRERFLREARTAALLAHPNVVPVYRADEAADTAFFAMAFIEGESLGERVRNRGPLPPADGVPIIRDVAWALAYAHARGVIHRDIKPENILLERLTRRTLVSDFGIAQHTALSEDAARLTQDGHVLGTVHYMSPEQVGDLPLDGRSDLYALGVVAYQALSGTLPFAGLSPSAVLVAHATVDAPPLNLVAPHLPSSLAAVVDRCLAKSPDDRYETGEALAEALEQALDESTGLVPRPGQALPPGLPERLDEGQAAALWRRAAQLQADALRRLDERDLRVPRASLGSGPVPSSERDAANAAVPGGYRLVDVAASAEEAGISRQYIALALAELPRGALPTAASLGIGERTATRFLGTDVRSIAVTVEIPAPPPRALNALGAVLRQSPYELELRETVGEHPLDGGVLVFDLPGPIVGASQVAAGRVNFYWMATHQRLEARQVQVTLKALPGNAARTAVTMTADLRPGVRRNVRVSQWLAGIAGSGTGFLTGAFIAKGAAVVASVAVLGPATGVAAVVAGLSLFGYRRLYSGTVLKAQGEMRRVLEAVASAIRSEAVFGPITPRSVLLQSLGTAATERRDVGGA